MSIIGMDHEVNWEFFHKLLENPKIPNMNMLEVCRFIYEATYTKYSIKFYEELYLREKYEQTIIKKQEEITKLEERIKELEGEQVPEMVHSADQNNS